MRSSSYPRTPSRTCSRPRWTEPARDGCERSGRSARRLDRGKALRQQFACRRLALVGAPPAKELELAPALEHERDPLPEIGAGAEEGKLVLTGLQPSDLDALPVLDLPVEPARERVRVAVELEHDLRPELRLERHSKREHVDGKKRRLVACGRNRDALRRARDLPVERRLEPEPRGGNDVRRPDRLARAAGREPEHRGKREEQPFAPGIPREQPPVDSSRGTQRKDEGTMPKTTERVRGVAD